VTRETALRVKRVVDVVGAGAGLVALSPLIAGAAVAVWTSVGRPIFFRHERPGYKGRPFTIRKFRTMRPAREGEVWFRTDEERLTRVGRFLRRTSIDELPQLCRCSGGHEPGRTAAAVRRANFKTPPSRCGATT
jgi:lipopolysaccharide/colanic/teichoic acid biosynthesis glycosyltransferase